VKRVFWIIPLIIIFSFVSCDKKAGRAKTVVAYEKSDDNSELALENEFLKLRFIPQTAGIILVEKASGAEWRSNPPPNDPLADTVTGYLMESQFSLEYADNAGVGMTLYSGSNSVSQGVYDYALVDGGLEVRYTVGDIARSYVIPPAAPEERMMAFLEEMELEDRRKVEAGYRLYDINNLRSSDDKNSLLSNYPDLVNYKMYVLRDTTQDYMKELFEEYFAGAGYTKDDYYEDTAKYSPAGGSDKPAFNITMRYTLDGKSLLVSVPFNKIAWQPAFPITQLSLLPYMGSGGLNDNGYIFVPDGSGSLIYFNNGKQNQVAYDTNIYGWDEAMPRDAVVTDNKAPFPVFGVHKNNASLLCVIEEGSAYSGVRADVSQRNSSWNNVYPRFDMIHGAKMDISGRSESAVYLYQSGLPIDESIVLRYTPCSGGYVGMAKEYRARLIEKYPFLKGVQSGDVPVAVEITGAVNKIRHRMGIPVDLPLKLTSYRETEAIINDLSDSGWKNVNIKLSGWFNHSYEHTVPNNIKLIGDLGSKRDFRRLVSTVANNGYELYPEAEFLFIKNVKPFDGFGLYSDAARYINRKRIERYPYSFVWYGERNLWGKISYIARPASMLKMIDRFETKAASLKLNNIAFRSMGARLCGDYNEKRFVSREAAINLRQNKLQEFNGAGKKVFLSAANVYAAPWASFITDMALEDQGYAITDVSVPFYQIVLHGLVPYSGKAVNLAENYTKHILKTVECGAGLYFSFMTEEAAVLQETKFRQFYANEYDQWAGDADALYKQFTEDFSGLYNQAIIDHVILSRDVTLTEYEDGTRVIVNLSPLMYLGIQGRAIAPDSYIVIRRGK